MMQSSFNIQGVRVRNICFDINDSAKKGEWKLNPSIALEVATAEGATVAKVQMKIDVFPDDDEAPFVCLLTMEGVFSWNEEMDSEEAMSFIKVNGAALLYSYARPIITQITTFANYSPLVLPLNNFTEADYTFNVFQEE